MAAVTITEEVVKLGTATYRRDDTVAVDEQTRALVIGKGWGVDPHTGEQGERTPGAVKIRPEAIAQSST